LGYHAVAPYGFLPESKARLGLSSKVRKSSSRQKRRVSLALKSRCDNVENALQVFPYVVLCLQFGNFVIQASGLYE
jgi:hypothetical protein